MSLVSADVAPALVATELVVHYGKRVAVDGVDLTLRRGEVVGLLGPNGAGKSTTLLALTGAVQPTRGTIAVGGVDMARAPLDAKRRVGFADQPPGLYEFFTVLEHVQFVAEARGERDAAAATVRRAARAA